MRDRTVPPMPPFVGGISDLLAMVKDGRIVPKPIKDTARRLPIDADPFEGVRRAAGIDAK
jgi:hypothetical protein